MSKSQNFPFKCVINLVLSYNILLKKHMKNVVMDQYRSPATDGQSLKEKFDQNFIFSLLNPLEDQCWQIVDVLTVFLWKVKV